MTEHPVPVPSALATCDRMLRRSLRAASVTILISFGLVGGWLAVARLDSAVVAQAVLENANTTRQIQHLEGGIVREFFVRNGDMVQQGDLLLRLDSTQRAASAELFQGQLLGNYARQERLEAELKMATELSFSEAIREQLAANPLVARIAEDEQRHFELQRKELEQSRELLLTTIAQAEAEIQANEVRRSIATRESELVRSDLDDQRSLRKKGLTNQASVTSLEQESLTLEEKIAQSDIDIARIRQAIVGFRLQIAQFEQEYRRRAAEQLSLRTHRRAAVAVAWLAREHGVQAAARMTS